MPELPPLSDAPRTSTPAAASPTAAANPAGTAAVPPAGVPAAPVNDVPPPGPATSPADAPPALAPSGDAAAPASGPPTSSPPELGPPSTDNRPGGSGSASGAVQVVDLPPLEPVPPAGQAAGPVAQQTAASASAPRPIRRATARRDGQILRTSAQEPAREADGPEIRSSWKQASMTAATVGDEIITMQDLRAAIGEHCQRTHTPFASLSREDRNVVGPMILRRMIDQSLLIQEAKRTIKNKMYDKFTEEADKFWREEQIPQLEVEFQADNEQQLREKIKDHGRSFETIQQITRQTWMAESFLHAKLKDRIKVDLPELRTYYNAHFHDREFDRPAEIAWREIVVEVGRYPSREEARRKVEALHRSLRDGADFAALAKAQSEGPSRSREQGGLMQTSPGSYGVATVNETLQALPIGQVSGILEGPSSFHIVCVEGRRAAGPAPFEELQDHIRSTLLEKKYQTERAAYIEKLWKETTVSTIFDGTESDPRLFAK
jgi:peptidyl-prolyl cis-trans isomerase SurA